MTIFTFKTANPARSLVIDAVDRAEADIKFNQMRDAAGLTEESEIVTIKETAPLLNIVEHAELEARELEDSKNQDDSTEKKSDAPTPDVN